MTVAPSLDAEDQVKAFIEKYKITEYAIVSDARKTAAAFKNRGVPSLYLVGKDGKVAWKGHRTDDPALTTAIEKALGK